MKFYSNKKLNMKKLFLFLLLFLVNKNAGVAQNHEISGGLGGVFMKNVETVNVYEAHYYNSWYIFGKNGELSEFGERIVAIETKANTYSFQKNASLNIGYNYAFRFKKIKLRLGVDYSFWKQNFTFSEAIKSSKILERDTSSIYTLLGTGDNPYPRATKFTNTIMNFNVPVKLSYVSNFWEFGIGAAFNMPLIFNQEMTAYQNNVEVSSDLDYPRSGIKQVGFNANLNVIKWFDNTGIELGANQQFRDILNIRQQITYGTTSNFPNLDAIPNKPLQVYFKIIKRF